MAAHAWEFDHVHNFEKVQIIKYIPLYICSSVMFSLRVGWRFWLIRLLTKLRRFWQIMLSWLNCNFNCFLIAVTLACFARCLSTDEGLEIIEMLTFFNHVLIVFNIFICICLKSCNLSIIHKLSRLNYVCIHFARILHYSISFIIIVEMFHVHLKPLIP